MVARHAANHTDEICMRGDSTIGPRPISFKLSCPKCGGSSECSRRRLYRSDRILQTTCTRCRRTSAAASWKCPCGKAWMNCVEHRSIGFRCGSRNVLSASSSNSSPNFELSQAAACNLRAAKRLRCIGQLGVVPVLGKDIFCTKKQKGSGRAFRFQGP